MLGLAGRRLVGIRTHLQQSNRRNHDLLDEVAEARPRRLPLLVVLQRGGEGGRFSAGAIASVHRRPCGSTFFTTQICATSHETRRATARDEVSINVRRAEAL